MTWKYLPSLNSVLHMLGKNFRRYILRHFSTCNFFSEKGSDILCKSSLKETICMKCLILFSGKTKKNISLSSVEFTHSMLNVNNSPHF